MPICEELGNQNESEVYFRDYFTAFLEHYRDVDDKTKSMYLLVGKHIISDLGHLKMSEINKRVVQDFLTRLTNKKYCSKKKSAEPDEYYSQSMLNKVYDLLHGAIKEALDDDCGMSTAADFMLNIKKPRSRKIVARRKKALTDTQIRQLLEAVRRNHVTWLWVNIMLYTGCRPSEALALTFDDIDYSRKTITFNKTLGIKTVEDSATGKPKEVPIIKLINKGNGISNRIRTICVGDEIIQKIREWQMYIFFTPHIRAQKLKEDTANLLFHGKDGKFVTYRSHRQAFNKLLKKAKIDGILVENINPYRLRSNFATRALRQGTDIKTAQLLMGHNSSYMILKHYADMDEDDIIRESSRLSSSFDAMLKGLII